MHIRLAVITCVFVAGVHAGLAAPACACEVAGNLPLTVDPRTQATDASPPRSTP